MAKIALRFTRPHGPFNTGERAALEETAARALIARGVAEIHHRQPATTADADAGGDPALKEALAALEKAQADLDHRESDLDAREAELSAREAAIAQREAEQDADWLPVEMPDDEETADDASPAAADDTGLPRQGR